MDFPGWVPHGARDYFEFVLGAEGLLRAEFGITHDGAVDEPYFQQYLDCAKRLASDERMREPYQYLQATLTDKKQYWAFLAAAREADQDYSRYREERKREQERVEQIAAHARELVRLLKESSEVRFVSSVMLTRKWTKDDPYADAKCLLYRLVGDAQPRRRRNSKLDLDLDEANAIKLGMRAAGDMQNAMLNMLDMLGTFRPWSTFMGGAHVNAAIASRKRNPKAEYLRAFAVLLMTGSSLEIGRGLNQPLDNHIISAMAGTASVVLNHPDIDVSADDVRSAIRLLKD